MIKVSSKTMEAKKKTDEMASLKCEKEKQICYLGILYPAKIVFKTENEIKALSDQ